jgi:hypothetical protein
MFAASDGSKIPTTLQPRKLEATDELSDCFPQPPAKNMLHLVVQVPPGEYLPVFAAASG